MDACTNLFVVHLVLHRPGHDKTIDLHWLGLANPIAPFAAMVNDDG